MKRKQNKVVWLIAGLTALMACLLLTACGGTKSLEERGYTVCVKYDFNGGQLDGVGSKTVYYGEGQPLIEPGTVNELKEPSKGRFYAVAGWKLAKTDGEGNVQKDADGNILTEDAFFDFSISRANAGCTLVAVWKEVPTVSIHVDGREDDIRTYHEGASVARYTTMEGREGYTFYDYYLDKELTQKAVFPLTLEDGDHLDLYTKWFEGDVLVVRSYLDLNRAGSYLNSEIWLDNDIDMGDRAFTALVGKTFNGKFHGNGYTIKNIKNTISRTADSEYYGLFGTLGGNAVIENVSFENIQIKAERFNPRFDIFRIGILAGNAQKGAKVSGCSFKDCTFRVEWIKEGLSVVYGKDTALECLLNEEETDGVVWENNTVVKDESGNSTVAVYVEMSQG